MVAEAVGGFLTGSLALVADAGHMLDRLDLARRLPGTPSIWPAARRRLGSPMASAASRRWSPTPTASPSSPSRCGSSTRRGSASSSPRPCSAGRCWWSRSSGCWSTSPASSCCMAATARASTCAARILHVLGDMLGSVGAIVAALVILATGWTPIDPILSVLVALLILSTAWSLMRDAAHVLLEGVPREPRPRRHRQRHRRERRRRARGPSHACLVARRRRRTWRRCMPVSPTAPTPWRCATSRRGWRANSRHRPRDGRTRIRPHAPTRAKHLHSALGSAGHA